MKKQNKFKLILHCGIILVIVLFIVLPLTSCEGTPIDPNDIFDVLLPNLTVLLVHVFASVVLIILSI
jgi:hypothetical protein